MLQPYRRVLSLPGTFTFSSAGLIARLPLSMTGLGLVLLVQARTQSYGLAGSVSAAYVLAAAVGAPAQGRLCDRVGQATVLRFVGVQYTLGVVLTLLSIESDWGAGWMHGCAVLAGVASPQAGSMVRSRWSHVIVDRSQLNTAFSLEAVIDEMVFIIGPVLVTYLTINVHEVGGLTVAAAAAALGTWLLAAQRRTEPPRVPAADGVRPALGWDVLGPVMFVSSGLGVLFGSTEIVVVAFATEAGQRAAAGAILAIWAAGSLLAGILVGAVSLPVTPLRQLRLSISGLTLMFVPLLFLHSVLALAVGMFIAGFMISPTLIAATELIEIHVPASRLTEGIAWTTTGLAIGVAPGAAVAGWVLDHHAASSGFAVPLVAGACATVATWWFMPATVATGKQLRSRPR